MGKLLTVGSLTAREGEKVQGMVEIPGGSIQLPVTLVNGVRPGKTLLITSGVHGGEYVGIQAAIETAASLQPEEREHVLQRAAYYNRLPEQGTRHYDMQGWPRIKDFRYPFGQKERHSNYFLDLYRVACHFNPEYRMAYRFGDITHETEVPALVKSRPVTEGPTNSVLLKLNQARHYFLWKDTLGFRSKKDMLVSRNVVRQPWRRLLLEEYAGHPLCDIGQTNRDTNTDHPEWMKDYLTIPRQLEYKFIACIEGNDVATNLKWVMASNSLAVMPRPRYETWFMEGRLIPDYHYVEIKEDYSDLPEKLGHYIRHPEQAESIIAHAR